jgi:hypothetical protein
MEAILLPLRHTFNYLDLKLLLLYLSFILSMLSKYGLLFLNTYWWGWNGNHIRPKSQKFYIYNMIVFRLIYNACYDQKIKLRGNLATGERFQVQVSSYCYGLSNYG